jgi:hypothetical protein
MQAYEGFIENGQFFPIGTPTRITGRRRVIMTVLDEPVPEQPKPQKRPIGFAKGAEIPDSFFEPLSEEELQAWGL